MNLIYYAQFVDTIARAIRCMQPVTFRRWCLYFVVVLKAIIIDIFDGILYTYIRVNVCTKS